MTVWMRSGLANMSFTFFLVAISAYGAVLTYPIRVWMIIASIGAVAFSVLILRGGWIIRCTALGVYAGLCMAPAVNGQQWELVLGICAGAILGCFVGFVIDSVLIDSDKSRTNRGRDTPR